MDNQGTPKNMREALANALAELRATKGSRFNGDLEEFAIDLILRHIRDRHAQDTQTAELRGETPTQLHARIFGETPDDGAFTY